MLSVDDKICFIVIEQKKKTTKTNTVKKIRSKLIFIFIRMFSCVFVRFGEEFDSHPTATELLEIFCYSDGILRDQVVRLEVTN